MFLFLRLVSELQQHQISLGSLPPTYHVIPDESESADGQKIHFRQTPEISLSHINIALTQQIRDEELRNQKRILFSKALFTCPKAGSRFPGTYDMEQTGLRPRDWHASVS